MLARQLIVFGAAFLVGCGRLPPPQPSGGASSDGAHDGSSSAVQIVLNRINKKYPPGTKLKLDCPRQMLSHWASGTPRPKGVQTRFGDGFGNAAFRSTDLRVEQGDHMHFMIADASGSTLAGLQFALSGTGVSLTSKEMPIIGGEKMDPVVRDAYHQHERSIEVLFTIAPGAPIGPRNLTATNAQGETATCSDVLTVAPNEQIHTAPQVLAHGSCIIKGTMRHPTTDCGTYRGPVQIAQGESVVVMLVGPGLVYGTNYSAPGTGLAIEQPTAETTPDGGSRTLTAAFSYVNGPNGDREPYVTFRITAASDATPGLRDIAVASASGSGTCPGCLQVVAGKVAPVTTQPPATVAGCTKDTDCKGTRICVDSRCRNP